MGTMEPLPNQSSTASKGRNIFLVLTAALACWYVLLCCAHFFYQRPLWNDEECVFQSIKHFSARQMFTEKLLNIQVFPRAYLFLIQRFSRLFDYHLLSLRFFSCVCMLSAFFIWLKVAGYEFKDRLGYITFVISWPASALLIYYSAELKQYSMDVFAAAIFLLFLYNQEDLEKKWPGKRCTAILVCLPALGLFSYPAFLFAFIVLYNLALRYFRTRQSGPRVLLYTCALLFFGVISYFFDMRFRHTMDVTQGFDDYFISFASVGDFFKTFQEGTLNLFTKWLVVRPRIIKKISTFFLVFGLLYMFYGFFKNIKREGYYLKSVKTIAFVLFVELFFLGALKKYPFTVLRTSLFFCPVVLLMTVMGIFKLKQINPVIYALVHGVYIIFLVFLMIGLSRITFAGNLDFQPIIWGSS